jgi:hypothetical protein
METVKPVESFGENVGEQTNKRKRFSIIEIFEYRD